MFYKEGLNYENLPFVRLVKPSPRFPVNVQFTCREPLLYRVHWLNGQGHMCPGTGCPVCRTSNVRAVAAFTTGTIANPFIIELGQSTWNAVQALTPTSQKGNYLGTRWAISSRSTTTAWDAKYLESGHCDQEVTEILLLRLVARLYRLPDVQPLETIADFQRRLSQASGQVLEGLCENKRGVSAGRTLGQSFVDYHHGDS